jgi:cell division septum initiation protein DivIVA
MKTYKKRHSKKTNKTLSQKGGNKENVDKFIDMLHKLFTHGASEVRKLQHPNDNNREKIITSIKICAKDIGRLVNELDTLEWH